MRVLVAGGAGFLGSHLVDRLLADGHEVVAVDSLITGARRNVAHLTDEPRFTLVIADIIHELPVGGRLDRVYNLASPASPIDYLERPFTTLYAGADGTRRLLERAEQDGARFLASSTSEVYGDPAVNPQPETYWGHVNPIGPRSVYDEAKRYAEALITAFRRYRDVDTRIARVFNTYGPRMRHDDGRVIPTFCVQALAGEDLTVFGDGTQTRSYCYVSDTVDGLVRLMESDEPGPVNVGNPYELTVSELATTLMRTIGGTSCVAYRPLPEDDPRVRRPDITRARERLGWEPVVPFDEGIAQTIAYFREVLAKA